MPASPPELTPAVGEARGSVALLQGCVQRVMFGRVNRAAVAVLAAEGFDVHAPAKPDCCGALELHAGEKAAAIRRATQDDLSARRRRPRRRHVGRLRLGDARVPGVCARVRGVRRAGHRRHAAARGGHAARTTRGP